MGVVLKYNEQTTTRPLVSKHLALFFVGIAFTEASRTMTMVQIPVFLRELGADIQQIGLFFTISMVFPLVLRVLGGWLSDSIGRLRAVWLGSLVGALAYIPFALATSWSTALLGPALLAVASALISPSFPAYIAEVSEKDALGRTFGFAETVRNIAWIIGPPVGGMIAQRYSYRWLFIAAILTYGIATLVFIALTRTRPPKPLVEPEGVSLASLRISMRELLALILSGGLVTWVLITDGVYDIASRLSFDLMPVYLSDIAHISKQQLGLLDGLHGIAWVAASPLAGIYVDKTSERAGATIGLSFLIASRLVFAFTESFGGFALSWILLGVGGAILQPALNSLIAKGVPSHLMGTTFALLATSLGLVSLPFPWIGSQIWLLIGPKAPFLITVLVGSLAIFPAWRKLVLPSKSNDKPEPETP
jgi:MFS family permease